jgi:hypothetical protein
MMRFSLVMAFLATGGLFGVELFATQPAAAQETYKTPWCETSSGIGKECYQNLAQCQQDQQGMGGFCAPTSDMDPKHPMGYGNFPQRPNMSFPAQ